MEKFRKFTAKIGKNPSAIFYLIIMLFVVGLFFNLFPNNKLSTVFTSNDPLVKSMANKLARTCVKNDRIKGNVHEEKENCYKENFKEIIDSYNFSLAEQTLYALQDIDESTKSCHILSHYISRVALKNNPDDWQYLLDTVNVSACGSGFLHGILEAHLGDDPNTIFTGQLSNEICNRGGDEYRKRMCTHFMGHFFLVSSNDVVADAVPNCDGVVDELRFDCLDGLFMEHNQRIALTDHGIAPPPIYTPAYAAELEKICFGYKGIQGQACWNEMAEVYAKTFGYSSKLVHDKCYNKKISDTEAWTCYSKGVVILATYPYDISQQELTSICGYYSDENRYKACTTNLLASLMYYSPKFTTRGILLCSNIEKHKEWCFAELGNQLSKVVSDPPSRLEFCSTANKEYLNLCAKIGS